MLVLARTGKANNYKLGLVVVIILSYGSGPLSIILLKALTRTQHSLESNKIK